MGDIYLTPKGAMISKANLAAWMQPDANGKNRYLVREFENERVSVRLMGNDTIHDGTNIPKEFWPRYRIEIENIVMNDSDGRPYDEPRRYVDPDSRRYRTLDAATKAFEQFLAKYTDCAFDEGTGTLIERGNLLAPPDPDKPTVAKSSPIAEEFGSW